MGIEKQRVLIASANPLFGEGIERLLLSRKDANELEIRRAENITDINQIYIGWQPQLIILDYDDQKIFQKEFLDKFVDSQFSSQVMLVSLEKSGSVIVYDRKTLTTEQANEWLKIPLDLNQENGNYKSVIPFWRKLNNMKHFTIVTVLVLIMTVVTNFFLQSVGLLPVEASSQAAIIDKLFDSHFLIISFLFSLIMVILVYSFVVFRKKDNDIEYGKYFTGSTKLEILWTLIPLGTVIFFSYLGAQSLAETRRIDPQAMTINVTAGQWYWSFEYPDYEITTDALYLPVDRQVKLSMTSVDVIHSFWVPEFRVKQDVLPGENLVKELRFTPTEKGDYTLRCAELCGGAHAYMNSPVRVVSDIDFQDWLDEQTGNLPQDPVSKGERLVTSNGCLGCHSLDGSAGVGPTWLGAFGSEGKLSDGSSVLVDENYLVKSIVNPNADIAASYYANVMPQTYGDQFSEEDINNIIAFIKSLK
jgi:cytochrome c oxidase subunit 2